MQTNQSRVQNGQPPPFSTTSHMTIFLIPPNSTKSPQGQVPDKESAPNTRGNGNYSMYSILSLLGISTLPCPFFAEKITVKDWGLAFPFSLLINPCASTGNSTCCDVPLLRGTVSNKLSFQGSCLCHLAIPD